MGDIRVERTRKKILNGLSLYLSKSGYSKTTVDNLADYIGVSKKTIYNHFENRDDLYLQALIYDLEKILSNLNKILDDESANFSIRLAKLLTVAYDELSKRINILNLMNSNFVPRHCLEQIVPEIIMNLKSLIKSLSEHGIDEGFIKEDDFDSDFFSHMVYVLVMGSLSIREFDFKYSRKEYFYMSLFSACKGSFTEKGINEFQKILSSKPWVTN
ncbi:MAG: TetR/AcrR family transcriptional regulator [Spirochaetales bacterium]|nr:TetR/AcrR family transcriptional regulator [Spirochaetales bacterium]